MSLSHDVAVGPGARAAAKPGVALSVRLPGWRMSAAVAMALAATAFAIAFVAHEEPAYSWDWVDYFNRYKTLGALAAKGGTEWIAAVLHSIRTADYNLAIVTPMLPAYRLFGISRVAYVAMVVLLYLVPAAAIAARLAARPELDAARRLPLWLFAAALLFWPFWFATLRGMPDIAGLIPLGGATLLVIDTRFLTRAKFHQGILLGVLIWLSFLLRRWYAYSDVALEAMCFVFALWTLARTKALQGEAARATALVFAVNVTTVVALLLVFQAPLVWRITHTSYAEVYLAYQHPLSATAQMFFSQTGLACLVAVALGLARAVLTRNATVLFMGTLAATTAFLFLRTQAPGAQHILPVCLWMFPIATFGVTWPLQSKPAGSVRRAGILIVAGAACAAVFVPAASWLSAYGRPILPYATYYPLKLAHPQAYRDLIADLEKRLDAPDSTVAVFASSPHLSDSLLASLAPRLRGRIVAIADVDARDGLRLAPFAARLAVITTRPALHLAPAMQQVVAVPDTMILGGAGPGRAYRRVAGPYRLDGDIEAFVYARDRPFTEDDAAELTRAMQAIYPKWVRTPDGFVN